MKYEDVRNSIKTGDLIAVKNKTPQPFALATRIVTNSPYTHTGIAIWSGGRLLLAQTNGGGCNLAPLSQEAIYDFDVFDCPVDRDKCEAVIWSELGTRLPYGYWELVQIFGYKVFGIPLPDPKNENPVCSVLSATIYKLSGWSPVGLPSIPWPGAVADQLQNAKKFEVTASS